MGLQECCYRRSLRQSHNTPSTPCNSSRCFPSKNMDSSRKHLLLTLHTRELRTGARPRLDISPTVSHLHSPRARGASRKTTHMTIQPPSSTVRDTCPWSSRDTATTCKPDKFHTITSHIGLLPHSHTPIRALLNSRMRISSSNSSKRRITTTSCRISSLPISCRGPRTAGKRQKMMSMGLPASSDNPACRNRRRDRKVPNSNSHRKMMPCWWNSKRPRTSPGSKLPTFSQDAARGRSRSGIAPSSRPRPQSGQMIWCNVFNLRCRSTKWTVGESFPAKWETAFLQRPVKRKPWSLTLRTWKTLNMCDTRVRPPRISYQARRRRRRRQRENLLLPTPTSPRLERQQ